MQGWVPVTAEMMGLIAVQALGTVIGVGLIIRGNLLAKASFVPVFEYTLLIFGELWGWMLWGQGLNGAVVVGIAFIMGSGTILARHGH